MAARVTKAPPRPRKASSMENGHRSTKPSNGNAALAPIPDEVRVRAYYKWVSAGCPSGDGSDFWFEAESELMNDAGMTGFKSTGPYIEG